MRSVRHRSAEVDLYRHVKAAEIAMRRNSPSLVIGDDRHYAIAVTDAQGDVGSISRGGLLGTIATTVREMLAVLRPVGALDILLTNDPLAGGNHVQDFTLLRPLTCGADVGYAVARFHTADFGGDRLGSFNPTADSIWAEGAIVPPMRIGRAGVVEDDILTVLSFNTRLPDTFRADLRAALAALEMLDSSISEVVVLTGPGSVRSALTAAMEVTEHRLAELFETVADGTWRAEGSIDHCCTGVSGARVALQLTLRSGVASFDYVGTQPSVKGFVNSPIGNTVFATVLPALTWMPTGQANSGAFRRIRVEAPSGSIASSNGWATGWSPYRTAREFARLARELFTASGLKPQDFEFWAADPRIAFMVPTCGTAECPLSNKRSLDTYSTRYSASLLEV